MENERPEMGMPNVPGEDAFDVEAHPEAGEEMPEAVRTPQPDEPEARRRDVDRNA